MSMSMSTTQPRSAAADSGPWWKHRIMWLVVGGPLAVVLASFVTIYLAISRPDPVYTDAMRQPSPAQASRSADEAQLAPAVQARNHAATGGVAKPAPDAAEAR